MLRPAGTAHHLQHRGLGQFPVAVRGALIRLRGLDDHQVRWQVHAHGQRRGGAQHRHDAFSEQALHQAAIVQRQPRGMKRDTAGDARRQRCVRFHELRLPAQAAQHAVRRHQRRQVGVGALRPCLLHQLLCQGFGFFAGVAKHQRRPPCSTNHWESRSSGQPHFCKCTETQRHRDTETQRHRDTETQRHKDTKTQRHRDTHVHIHGDTHTRTHTRTHASAHRRCTLARSGGRAP